MGLALVLQPAPIAWADTGHAGRRRRLDLLRTIVEKKDTMAAASVQSGTFCSLANRVYRRVAAGGSPTRQAKRDE